MATPVTLALTAITTITDVEKLLVFALPKSLFLMALDEPVAFCAATVETIVLVVVVVIAVGLIADEGLTTVVLEVIELVGEIVSCGTKEEETETIWRLGSR